MRHLVLAALATLGLTTQSHAYEIEEQQIFGAGAKEISVLSTTDLAAISQVMQAFADARPDLRIRYDQAASIEVFRAIHDEAVPYDLVMSSAMDLQMKLANDGFAASIMPKLGNLPAWARWRDQLFGVALEPVVTLASRRGLGDLPVPHTRRDLIAMMREHPDALNGRIATYDPQQSGVGYFLISQDSRESEGFWRLAEVMGRLNTRLFCCSVEMIDELRAGRITIAYNVVASYASRFTPGDPDLVQLALEDYTFAIVRSALVPSNANDPAGRDRPAVFPAVGCRATADRQRCGRRPDAPALVPNLRRICDRSGWIPACWSMAISCGGPGCWRNGMPPWCSHRIFRPRRRERGTGPAPLKQTRPGRDPMRDTCPRKSHRDPDHRPPASDDGPRDGARTARHPAAANGSYAWTHISRQTAMRH